MPNIHINWTTDEHDCDDCGPSFADGARVDIEGRGRVELTPSAGCYDGVSHSRLYVFLGDSREDRALPGRIRGATVP